MAEHTPLSVDEAESDISIPAELGPSCSSDPNDWCPKHGPHPSD